MLLLNFKIATKLMKLPEIIIACFANCINANTGQDPFTFAFLSRIYNFSFHGNLQVTLVNLYNRLTMHKLNVACHVLYNKLCIHKNWITLDQISMKILI